MAAQKESETISGNLRWSYKKRMESGEYNCTKTPFGYDLIDVELKVNDKEADIIKDVFSLYLNWHGIHSIAEFLNGRKIKNVIQIKNGITKILEF